MLLEYAVIREIGSNGQSIQENLHALKDAGAYTAVRDAVLLIVTYEFLNRKYVLGIDDVDHAGNWRSWGKYGMIDMKHSVADPVTAGQVQILHEYLERFKTLAGGKQAIAFVGYSLADTRGGNSEEVKLLALERTEALMTRGSAGLFDLKRVYSDK